MENSLKDDLKVVTTEKDYLRIKDYGHKNLIVAKVKLIIENKDNFINEIMNINAKKIKYLFEAILIYSFFYLQK